MTVLTAATGLGSEPTVRRCRRWCLADDAEQTWTALLAGHSGIAALAGDFVQRYDLPVRIGGTLRMNPAEHLTKVERRRLSVVAQLAVVLGRRLWRDSGLTGMDGDRLAVAIGTGLGGADAMIEAVDALRAAACAKSRPCRCR
jgi:beta-ketoacyl ACP synthase